MTGTYDAAVDAAYISLGIAEVIKSREVWPGIRFDFDDEGRILGIEILDASTRLAAGAAVAIMDVR